MITIQTGERQTDRQTGVYYLSSCPLSCSHVEDKGIVTVSGWQPVQMSQFFLETWKRRVQRHQLSRDTADTWDLERDNRQV